MMLPSLRLVAGLAGLVVLVASTSGRLAARPPQAVAQFSSGVQVVEVYTSVTDSQAEPVTGLTRSDFTVLEDGVPQQIEAFAAGEFPLSVAVAIDRSASMAGDRLDAARLGARSFLEALRAEDRAMVIGISSSVEVVAPLSTDRAVQLRALQKLTPWSTTSLHDAVIEGIDLVQPAVGRRALVVLSDGADRFSRASLPEVLDRARRSDVMVYPIALGRETSLLFPQLARLTGGRSFHVTDPRRLSATLTAIARDLRFQYLLGYTPGRVPTPAGEPEWRAIEVRVARSGLRVRARDGYFARRGQPAYSSLLGRAREVR